MGGLTIGRDSHRAAPSLVGFAPRRHGSQSRIRWQEAEHFRYADRNPYVGPAQVAEGVFGRLLGEWERFAVSPTRLIDGGDTIVALGRYIPGCSGGTGQVIDAQFAHVWTVADGRVTSFQQYTDTAQFAYATAQSAVV